MLTQQEFVEGCLNYYAENYYEQGNPEDGEWERAHYPTPKCLGGTETILLLREHHALQGILQSEEVNHPCIWGWEKSYLPKEMLPLYHKWCSEKSRLAMQKMDTTVLWDIPHEERVRRGKKAWEGVKDKVIDDYRQRMRDIAHLGRKAQAKPVEVVYTTGEKNTYASIAEAATALGMQRQNVSKLVIGGIGNKKRHIASVRYL